MKLLSHVTLALHFSAVMILVGSLLLVIYHNFRGRRSADPNAVSTSFTIARRLPVLMTFVINLGVPPLLFAQVLYGRAIYSSSILIGVMWFSVILLVMLDYWLLYRITARIEATKSGWQLALCALFVTMAIGNIYSTNMTLMLRPEVWQEMYAKSAAGLSHPTDPTLTPRWMFVMAGGLTFGGVWALLLSNMKHVTDEVKATLAKSGGVLAVLGAVTQTVCGYMVFSNQPQDVQTGLGAHPLYKISGLLFLATIVVTALIAAMQGLRGKANFAISIVGVLTAFLSVAGAVIYRDGIRDLTLQSKGFDVWNRTEASNWSVIGLFLLLFVAMVGIVIWLLNVMRKANPPMEQVEI